MLTLVLNELSEKAIELINFNRNTSFNSTGMSSTAYCTLKGNAAAVATLQEIGLGTIEHLQINKDETPIYVLENQDAKLTSMSEYLNGDQIDININIDFNIEVEGE